MIFWHFLGIRYLLDFAYVLYGKRSLLEGMDAFEFGGDMIEFVQEQNTTFRDIPHRFEAGTMDAAA